jgi:hypothetical protein
VPSARVAPVGDGGTVDVGGGAVDGGVPTVVVEDVHDAPTSATVRTRKIARARMSRRYTREEAVGSDARATP